VSDGLKTTMTLSVAGVESADDGCGLHNDDDDVDDVLHLLQLRMLMTTIKMMHDRSVLT